MSSRCIRQLVKICTFLFDRDKRNQLVYVCLSVYCLDFRAGIGYFSFLAFSLGLRCWMHIVNVEDSNKEILCFPPNSMGQLYAIGLPACHFRTQSSKERFFVLYSFSLSLPLCSFSCDSHLTIRRHLSRYVSCCRLTEKRNENRHKNHAFVKKRKENRLRCDGRFFSFSLPNQKLRKTTIRCLSSVGMSMTTTACCHSEGIDAWPEIEKRTFVFFLFHSSVDFRTRRKTCFGYRL